MNNEINDKKFKQIRLIDLCKTYPSFGIKDLFLCDSLSKEHVYAKIPENIVIIKDMKPECLLFNVRTLTLNDIKSYSKFNFEQNFINSNRMFIDNTSTLREDKNSNYKDIEEFMNKIYNKFYIGENKTQNFLDKSNLDKIDKTQNISNNIITKNNMKFSLIDRAYDLNILNTDSNYPLEKIIQGVKNFAKNWKLNENKVKTCTLLFHGFPGTGKTEFGKYLASETGLPFMIKRASDIFDKYVGETEKLLANTFLKAKQDKSILMIDEADTFLENRIKVDASHERSRVNELLCQLENHEGIVICSTNFLTNIDSAALRRFIFKIEFKPLTNNGKYSLAKKMLNEVCNLPEDMSLLNNINLLTPGDFKAVRDKLLIINNEKISWNEIIKELKLEVQYKLNDEYYKKFNNN